MEAQSVTNVFVSGEIAAKEAEVAKRTAPIEMALMDMGEAQEELSLVMDQLNARLSPVLRREDEAELLAAPTGDDATAPLTARLRSFVNLTRARTGQLRYMIDKLEV